MMRVLKEAHRCAMARQDSHIEGMTEGLKTYEEQLKQSNNELVAAQKEAKEANERIMMVWMEMQKAQGISPVPKRKSTIDASESLSKKARTEDQP